MTRPHLTAMATAGTLVPAVEKLLEACRAEYEPAKILNCTISNALLAFEPSPLDITREKLKAAGFEQVPPRDACDRGVLRQGIVMISGCDDYWRLKEPQP